MIFTDPLSLVFIFCFLLGFGFFLVATLMGGHGHADGHVGHLHVHLPGAGHAPVHGAGHAPVHSAGHAPHAASHASHVQHTSASTNTSEQQTTQQPGFSLGSYLNPTSIALFLLGFGFFGYLLNGYLFHNANPGLMTLSVLLAGLAGLAISAAMLTTLSRMIARVESSTEQDVVDRTGMLGKVSITIPEKGLGEIIYTSPGGMRKSIPARGLNNQHLERDAEVVVVNYENGVAEVDTWEHFMHGETNLPDPTGAEELPQLHVLLNQSDAQVMEMLMRQEQKKE